jgi:hypothetical protein
MVLHLLDKAELDLPYDKQITLQDLETDEKLQINPEDLRETYTKQVDEYLSSIRRGCNDCDFEYHPMFVHEPYDKALIRLITRRA